MKRVWKQPVLLSAYAIAVIVLVAGCTYVVLQQRTRQAMNYPQVQIAEDGAARLNAGGVPADLVSRSQPPIDIKTSLDTWVAVFDQKGTPLESSAKLGSEPLQLPKGLFDASTWSKAKTIDAPTGKETRITWQPEPGVRQALV